MTIEERVSKAYNEEVDFLSNLVGLLIMRLKADKGVENVLTSMDKKRDYSKMSVDEFLNLLCEMENKILEGIQTCEYVMAHKDKLHKFVGKNIFQSEPERMVKSVDEIIQIEETTISTLKTLVSVYEFASKVAGLVPTLKNDDPIATIRSLNLANKRVKKFAKDVDSVCVSDKISFSEVISSFFDAFMTPEIKDLFSVESLEKELILNSINKSKKETNDKHKKINIEKSIQELESDLRKLQIFNFVVTDVLKLEDELNALKQRYMITRSKDFSKNDESEMIENLKVLISEFDLLKQTIFNQLVYENLNINDILREESSYIVRDYRQKLLTQSEKLNVMVNSLNSDDINSLIDFYKKLVSTYRTIDEMKMNSYVPELARFQK